MKPTTMKWIILFLLLPVFSFSQKGRRIDVKNFEAQKVEFDFKPSYDLFQLRHDVYRQTHTESVNDSVSKTEPVSYNQIGFDIGKFLFVDYNHNITIQINKLLDINQEKPFLISRSTYPFRKNKTDYYQFEHGVYSFKRNNRSRKHEQFNLKYSNNATEVYYKKRFQYQIIETEDKLSKKGRKRWNETIFWNGDENYSNSKRKIWADNYFKENEVIHIDKEFLIRTNENRDAIEICHWSRNQNNKPIYTIRYNDRSIIIYDKKRRGYYIQYSPDNVSIFQRGKNIVRYERIR